MTKRRETVIFRVVQADKLVAEVTQTRTVYRCPPNEAYINWKGRLRLCLFEFEGSPVVRVNEMPKVVKVKDVLQ